MGIKMKLIADDCLCVRFTHGKIHQDAEGMFILFDGENMETAAMLCNINRQSPLDEAEMLKKVEIPTTTQEAEDYLKTHVGEQGGDDWRKQKEG